MSRHDVTDEVWNRVEPLMAGRRRQFGRAAFDNRRFLHTIIYVAKTGIAWRDLPTEYGKRDTAYHRYNNWCRMGRWQAIFDALQAPDLEWLLIDSTVIRAHHHAAEMNPGGVDEDLGRSRGGFGTKIHTTFDALGNPTSFQLSPGQDADATHAVAVIGDQEADSLVGDKGYDSDAFVDTLTKRGIDPVIPSRNNRT